MSKLAKFILTRWAMPGPFRDQRRRWIDRIRSSCHRYWPELDSNVHVTLSRPAIRGSNSRVVVGAVSDSHRHRPFCLKWCPKANADELALTYRRLMWWRGHHPELAHAAAEPLDLWSEENVLLMTRSEGKPLSRRLSHLKGRRYGTDLEAAACAFNLGTWLHAFAHGHEMYGTDVEPMLGTDARRRPDGRLTVNARRLLETRIDRGRQALHALARAGVAADLPAPDRLGVDDTVAAFGYDEAAGFIHGDLKPDNVLVHGGSIVVIDWWTTPRVSWPLTDVAVLAGQLRLGADRDAAGRFWARLVEAYYPNGMDERTRRATDLIAATLRWTLAAERLQRVTGQ